MTEMRETWKEFSAALGHTFRFIHLRRLSLQSELSDEEITALCLLSNTFRQAAQSVTQLFNFGLPELLEKPTE